MHRKCLRRLGGGEGNGGEGNGDPGGVVARVHSSAGIACMNRRVSCSNTGSNAFEFLA